MTIEINNPKIEAYFINEFKSDIKKFSEFILINLEKYPKQNNEFKVKTLDPKKNSSSLVFDNKVNVESSDNPFKDIEDVATYAKNLREKAWR